MKRFAPPDYTRIVVLNSIQAIPGSPEYLVNKTVRDLEENCLRDRFCLMTSTGQVTVELDGSSAQVSPDGKKIAYESDGSLHIYDLTLGSSSHLVNLYSSEYFMGHMAENNFAWSPDSQSIAYISCDVPQPPGASATHETDRLLYKSKGGRGRERFARHNPSHIWIVPIKGSNPYCLTPGSYNEHSLSWSADGKSIAFISDRSGNPDRTHRNDLLRVDLETGSFFTLVQGKGTRFKPNWAPSGDTIAFLADESEFTSKDSPAPDVHIYTTSTSGKNYKRLAAFPDRRADNIKWSSKGDKIYFTIGDSGRTELHTANLVTDSIEPLVQGNFQVKDYCVNESNGTVAIIRNSINQPDEVYVGSSGGSEFVKISSFNTFTENDFQFTQAESFWFDSSDDTKVQGWLMRPAPFKEGETYPLILVIHGGPHNMFGFEFDDRMQLLAASGFGVVFFNPRGSSGYGQQFTNGNLKNWGGNDYTDIMNGMNYVISRHAWVDKDNLGVTGQSYGGFMTNWIITQTNLFKAAVSDGSISNLVSFAGTSLYHCLMEAEFGGEIWDNYDELWNWSPLKYVKNVTTPTLFLHGDIDNEVPVSQAEEMYSALKRLGVETKLVRYLQEGHGWRPDMLPKNRIDLMTRMINWFNNYLTQRNK